MFFSSPRLISRLRPARARRRGAVLIEFAISVTVLSLILLGLLQYGVYLSATNSLWNLSREAARYASVEGKRLSNPQQDIYNYITDNRRRPPNLPLTNSAGGRNFVVTVTPSNSSALTAGTPVTVAIQFDMSTKTFVSLPDLPGLGSRYVTAQTTMRVEGN